jgi:hypothetical protein
MKSKESTCWYIEMPFNHINEKILKCYKYENSSLMPNTHGLTTLLRDLYPQQKDLGNSAIDDKTFRGRKFLKIRSH